MWVAKVRNIPLGNYANGMYEFGPWAFPNGLDGFDIRIGRCTTAEPTLWPSASAVVDLQLQFSYDGGATWTPLGANGWSQGGGIINHKGSEIPESVLTWRFHPDEPTHAKAQITVTGGPIRTYLDVTVL